MPKPLSYYKWVLSRGPAAKTRILAAHIYKDHDFPVHTKKYDSVRDYLEMIETPNTILDVFEESWDIYLEYLDEVENA